MTCRNACNIKVVSVYRASQRAILSTGVLLHWGNTRGAERARLKRIRVWRDGERRPTDARNTTA